MVQKNDLTIWKLKGVMMGGWLVHVDLAKNRSGVLDPVLIYRWAGFMGSSDLHSSNRR
jgi:hypothetical protein